MLDQRILPWAEAWERSRLLNVYKGLAFRDRPQQRYVFLGHRRHDYEFGPLSRGHRKTKAVFLPGNYRPIMGGSPATFFLKTAGNDGNTGLGPGDAEAWATFTNYNVNNAFAAGDIVQLNRGDTWNENADQASNGADGSPIITQAYGSGAKPKIVGQLGQARKTALVVTSESDLLFRDLDVTAPDEASSFAIYIDDTPRSTVEDCDTKGAPTPALSVGIRVKNSIDCTVQRCTADECSQGVVAERTAGFGAGTVLTAYIGYNTVVLNDQDITDSDPIVLYQHGDWAGTVVEHNDCSQFEEDGMDLSCDGGIVQFNTIHDCRTTGALAKAGMKLFVVGGSGVNMTVRYNLIHTLTAATNNGMNGIRAIQRAAIYYNVLRDLVGAGNANINGLISEGLAAEIYNNTIVGITRGTGEARALVGSSESHTFHNNICDAQDVDIRVSSSAVVTGGFNCLKNDAAATVVSGSYSGGGDDLGTTDPLFMNAAGDDYHLKSNSPCIEAGTPLALDDKDYDGIPLGRGTNPDIGAFETLKGGPRGL